MRIPKRNGDAINFHVLFFFFNSSLFFFKILFIYLRESAQAWGEMEGEGEADSLLSREPAMGLHPRTPGS